MDYFWLIFGFVVLILGGDFLVKGSVGLAVKAQISKLVIGMTVVSFGTSSPELLVSMGAALEGGEKSYMSIGNVIGSNIANLGIPKGNDASKYFFGCEPLYLLHKWQPPNFDSPNSIFPP